MPLKGIKVLEMGTFITGPAAAMLLGDLGADVVKVEQPEGDPFRHFRGTAYSPHFQTYNRNKRSITLNTKTACDLDTLHSLVRDADVFIQNFRPGVAERLGVSAGQLRALNSRLVYCSISGFGDDGPDRLRPAFDTVAQAAGGFLRLLLNPKNPRVVGPAIADAITGFYAAYGILAALVERTATGAGRTVEVSMFEAMAHFNLDDFTHLFSAGLVMDATSRPAVSQSYVFECGDAKWIALHMSSPAKFWEGLAESVGHPKMLEDPRFRDRESRIENYDAVVDYLAPLFRRRPRHEWRQLLDARDVPNSEVRTSAEVIESAQARALQLEVQATHPVHGLFRTIRNPLSFDGARRIEVSPPPVIGEHNDDVAAGLWRQSDGPAATGGRQ